MPRISNKGMLMPESPIRKLVPYAENAKKNGVEVFHLNIGQPDIKTPEVALQAIKNNTIEILAYGHSEGSESYRTNLTKYYAKNFIDINPDDIIVTIGGSEALLFAIGIVADPGDEIIIPEPFYANYNGFLTSSGVDIVPVTSHIDDNFALPKIAEFEKKITAKTKAILICNPGNPTGYVYSRDEIQQLADLVKKHDLFIIVDEVYREFVYSEEKHCSILSNFGLDDQAILIDSVSKRYSMCGARIGCLVSKNKDVIRTALKFAQARLSPPTFAQIASNAALSAPQSYYDDVIVEYRDRRDILVKELSKIADVKIAIPQGAFYCVVELPVDDTDKFAQWLLEDFNLNNQTVMVAPAAGFYATPGLGNKQVRIAYVLNKADLIKSVNILKVALETYNKI